MNVTVYPSAYKGELVAVPSKSHAHRLMIAAALKRGKTTIKNVGRSDDVRATAECLGMLGAAVEFIGPDAVVTGIKKVKKGETLNARESGSTLRFLLPIAAALGADCDFTGKGRLFQRPCSALRKALEERGTECDGKKVRGKLSGGEFTVDATVSSQYVSGLLLALPLLEEDSELILDGEVVSKNYILMTLDVLERSGIAYEKTERGFRIPGRQEYRLPDVVECEGDWSGAAFMLVAGALGGTVRVSGLFENSLQGDKKIVDVIKASGGKVTIKNGTVEVGTGRIEPFVVDIEDVPDLAPVLAVLAAYANGESKLVHVRRLRLKESDRLGAIEQMLSAAGITSFEENDILTIFGGNPKCGFFDGKGDHRMVMSEVLLAGSADGQSVVSDAEAVNKSYPTFFEDYRKAGGKIHVDMEG